MSMYQLSHENIKNCPNCAESIKSAAIYCRYCHRGLSLAQFKKCPYCAEMIRKNACLCRFCKSDLSEQSGPTGGIPPRGAPVPRIPISPLRSTETALPLPVENESCEAVTKPLPKKKKPEK